VTATAKMIAAAIAWLTDMRRQRAPVVHRREHPKASNVKGS
jgi:hypothetical protein